jgi:two-component system chemotaxis response regulator CheY
MSADIFPKETRILVVDDTPSIREDVLTSLNRLGYTDVLQASNGSEGWDVLNKPGVQVDLIICDQNMPEMTGIQLLTKVRESPLHGNLPFLMLTTEGDSEIVFTAIKLKVHSYLLKPFNTGSLQAKLKDVWKRVNTPKKPAPAK